MKGTAYLLQAALIASWWVGLYISQDFYRAFQFPGIGQLAFNAFMLPDLIIVALLSVIRAYWKKRELDFIILGGFGFATLYCINATILTQGGFLSTTAMTLGLCYNLFLINGNQLFKSASTDHFWLNLAKTILQVGGVWTITLFVFPMLILKSFGGIPPIKPSLLIIGASLFILFSTLGLYSAYVMVKIGQGTPLPLDQSQKLVTQGPYKYVRNPMAVAGIGQGMAIGVIFLSVPIFIYTLLGAILWQYVVRPIEEEDMVRRFGKAYEAYRKSVNCWIPW